MCKRGINQSKRPFNAHKMNEGYVKNNISTISDLFGDL